MTSANVKGAAARRIESEIVLAAWLGSGSGLGLGLRVSASRARAHLSRMRVVEGKDVEGVFAGVSGLGLR